MHVLVRKLFQTLVGPGGGFSAHFVQAALTNGGIAVVGLITGSLLARYLGPSGRGVFAAVQTLPLFLASFSALGLVQATIYHVARDPSDPGRILGTALGIIALATGPFILVGYVTLPVILEPYDEAVLRWGRLFLILIPLFGLGGLPVQFLRGLHDYRRWNVFRALPSLGWLTALILIGILGLRTLEAVAIAFPTVLAVTTIMSSALVIRRVPTPLHVSRRESTPLLKYGLPSITAEIPYILNHRLDQIVLIPLVSAQALGFYAIAVAWSSAIMPLLTALSSLVLPRIAASRPGDEAAALSGRALRVSVVFGGGLAVLQLLATPFLLPLIFGRDFSGAVPVGVVLVLAGAVLGVGNVAAEVARGLGRPRFVMFAQVIGLLVTAVGLWLVVPSFGIMGAAVVSLCSYTLILVALMIGISWQTSLSAASLILPRRADFAEIRAACIRKFGFTG